MSTQSAPAIARLVNAVGELATNHPITPAQPTTGAACTVLSPHWQQEGVPVDLAWLHLVWIMEAAVAARADADRSHDGHPLQGVCAWCHPDPWPPGNSRQSLAERTADAIGELVTNYPTAEGPTSTLCLSEADDTRHSVPLDMGHVTWLAELIETARDQVERAERDVCHHCGQTIGHDDQDEGNPVVPDPRDAH